MWLNRKRAGSAADFLPDLNESYFNDARGFGPGNEQDPAIIKARSNMTNGWVDLVHLSMQLRTNPIREIMLQAKNKYNADQKQLAADKIAQNAALEAFRSGPNSLPINIKNNDHLARLSHVIG